MKVTIPNGITSRLEAINCKEELKLSPGSWTSTRLPPMGNVIVVGNTLTNLNHFP